jgi:hypothetical protein
MCSDTEDEAISESSSSSKSRGSSTVSTREDADSCDEESQDSDRHSADNDKSPSMVTIIPKIAPVSSSNEFAACSITLGVESDSDEYDADVSQMESPRRAASASVSSPAESAPRTRRSNPLLSQASIPEEAEDEDAQPAQCQATAQVTATKSAQLAERRRANLPKLDQACNDVTAVKMRNAFDLDVARRDRDEKSRSCWPLLETEEGE